VDCGLIWLDMVDLESERKSDGVRESERKRVMESERERE